MKELLTPTNTYSPTPVHKYLSPCAADARYSFHSRPLMPGRQPSQSPTTRLRLLKLTQWLHRLECTAAMLSVHIPRGTDTLMMRSSVASTTPAKNKTSLSSGEHYAYRLTNRALRSVHGVNCITAHLACQPYLSGRLFQALTYTLLRW